MMTTVFGRSLDRFLRHFYTPQAEGDPARRQKWFAGFASEKVMPLLTQTAKSIEMQGGKANCRLSENDGRLAAELEIIPGHGGRPATPTDNLRSRGPTPDWNRLYRHIPA
jgi:hypothetical protein